MTERLTDFTPEAAAHNMELLADNSYPGRGIVLGQSESGESLIQVYWITGRSDLSKNRTILNKDGEIWSEPYDKSKVIDPLTVYRLMGEAGTWHVVSNGSQTQKVLDAMGPSGQEEGFKQALEQEEYEPDSLATPRITGMSRSEGEGIEHHLSIIRRSDDGTPDRRYYATRFWNGTTGSSRGLGTTIHTYESNGEPVPIFDSKPYALPVGEGAEDAAEMYWEALDATNKVALVVKEIDRATGEITLSIKNAIE